ncbi:hypothetical protein BHE74_00009430 [Ensete ventricosum]|nr:hypothetical protein BHE74_00009430 [Ensete ventricosum]
MFRAIHRIPRRSNGSQQPRYDHIAVGSPSDSKRMEGMNSWYPSAKDMPNLVTVEPSLRAHRSSESPFLIWGAREEKGRGNGAALRSSVAVLRPIVSAC